MSCEKGFNYTEAYRQHGNEKYLGEGETFEGVVAQDAKILEMHGVTKEEVGQSLRAIFSTFSEFLRLRAPGAQHPCLEIKLGSHTYELGFEGCPYVRGLSSNRDWIVVVEGLSNGNKAYHPEHGPTLVSDMLPAMIEQRGFFEGTVFYGIKPEWAIAVHRIVQANELTPYAPKKTPRAWDGYRAFFKSWEGKSYDPTDVRLKGLKLTEEERELLYPVKQIINNSFVSVQVAPDIMVYVVPGDMQIRLKPWTDTRVKKDETDSRKEEYWGLLVAEKETVLPPDATLLGIPFDADINHFNEGDMLVIRVLPYFDKLVG